MNTEHTKGKWKVNHLFSYKNVISILNTGEGKTLIAEVVIGDNLIQSEANANLIASAPELLEALILAKDLLTKGHDIENINDERLIKIRYAIQKATT